MKINSSKFSNPVYLGFGVFLFCALLSFGIGFFKQTSSQKNETSMSSQDTQKALNSNENSLENQKTTSHEIQSAENKPIEGNFRQQTPDAPSKSLFTLKKPVRETWEEAKLKESSLKLEEWISKDSHNQLADVLALPATQDRYFNGLLLNSLGQFGRNSENSALIAESQEKLYGFLLLAAESMTEQTQAEALQALQSLTNIGKNVEAFEFESLLPKFTMLLAKNTASMLVSLQDYRAKNTVNLIKNLIQANGFLPSILQDSLEKSDTLEELRNLEILLK